MYFANPCTEAVRDAMSARLIGCIITPGQGNQVFPDDGWDVIADNGCFSARWNHRAWLTWLLGLPRTVRFAVAPDVFDPTGGPCHEPTVERWRYYGPLIERHGFTPAFVCQVGTTPANVPTDAPVLFLGGDTRWKLGPIASAIIRRHGSDRWVHMGRVNSLRRFRAARSMGCDSADGTYLTFGPDQNLPRLLGWLDDQHQAPMLAEAMR
jgi:hypothetical protein